MNPVGLLVWTILVSVVVGPLAALAGQRYERRRLERLLLQRAGWRGLDGAKADLDHRDAVSVSVPGPAANGESRMDQLERSIDAVALELERIGEGQRFLTKLLGERRPDAPNH
jgi:hypothetical protein